MTLDRPSSAHDHGPDWAALATDPATAARYRALVLALPAGNSCWPWTGAVSDTGHGKFRAGSRTTGSSRVVTAHVLGWWIAHGPLPVGADVVVAHRCDESWCQRPDHWEAIDRRANVGDWSARRHRRGHALADTRGAAGRARAVREAAKTALAAGTTPEQAADLIAQALAAGAPDTGQLDLW